MDNQIEYKGYLGEAVVDMEAGLIHGRVINIENDVLTFRGETAAEAKQDFQAMIDEYLADCAAAGESAETPKKLANA